ncbi:MAG: GDSL-type esterase/lipase family protein [Hyphomicrobiales bacterium]|nr:GDSL-type esterase/lipase family protein [Hyphomicrobiales bacterium]
MFSVRTAVAAAILAIPPLATPASAAQVVALGASNTYGKGVARNAAYPAQLEAILAAQGVRAKVKNAGINGDTTGGMLARLPRALDRDTRVLLLQPGGNDARKGVSSSEADANLAAIRAEAARRSITVIEVPNRMLRNLPHQPDGQHLTPEGYGGLAGALAGEVAAALR